MVLPGVVVSFTANVYLINPGQSATLTWVTNNPVSASLNGATVASNGSKSVSPSVTTTYTLQSYTEGGGTSKSLTIVVAGTVPPPTPPPTTTYNLNITTVPGGCTVTISDYSTFTTPTNGVMTIGGVPAGTHTITVSKVGYQAATLSRSFTGTVTLTVSLTASPVICTPGALKCIGVDLYVCNTAGTAWTLKTANSPTCKAAGAIPDFWVDPVGWVIGTITAAWEAMLGFISGQFNIFLNNLKNFQNNFMAQLVAFIADPVTKLKAWLAGIWTTLTTVVSEISKGITSWWASTSASVMSWINSAIKSANDWIANFATTISSWWTTASKSVMDWINAAVKGVSDWATSFAASISTWWNGILPGLQSGWNTITGSFQGLIDTAVSGIKTWAEGFINTLIEAIVGGFFNGVTKGINEAGHSPLDTEKETDNVILKGLQLYMINYRKERDLKKVK
jgi:hypothetical protein